VFHPTPETFGDRDRSVRRTRIDNNGLDGDVWHNLRLNTLEKSGKMALLVIGPDNNADLHPVLD
jgi:hypothetical protein